MKAILTLAALLTATGAAAQWTPAAEARLSQENRDCERAAEAAGTNSSGYIDDITECTRLELVKQDARLNQAYKMVMMRLPAKRKVTLRNLQRRWIVERDQECDSEVRANDGGTVNYMEASICRLQWTINRTIWLEGYR